MAIENLFQDTGARKALVCETCGKTFLRYQSQMKGQKRIFCSMDCRKFGQNFPCSECGELVYRKKHEIEKKSKRAPTFHDTRQRNAIFCNEVCRHDFDAKSRLSLVCATCGEPFEKSIGRIKRPGRGKFCSRQCSDAFGRFEMPCAWPGCCNTFQARKFRLNQRGEKVTLYKTQFITKGRVTRFAVCDHHQDIAQQYLGEGTRINGRLKWLSDPNENLGSRSVNNQITRLVIFCKNDGKCNHCQREMDFRGGHSEWHVDHIVPVYKGGKTNFNNLQPLCRECHDLKSSGEKSDVGKRRHSLSKLGRWMTHPEKDELIMTLRAEIVTLRNELEREKEKNSWQKRSALTKSSRSARILEVEPLLL